MANVVSAVSVSDQDKFSTPTTPDRQFTARRLKSERADTTNKRFLRVSDKADKSDAYSTHSKPSSSASGSDNDEERIFELSGLPFLEQATEEFESMLGTGEAVHHTLHANEIALRAKEKKEELEEEKEKEESKEKDGSSDSASGSSSKGTDKKHAGQHTPHKTALHTDGAEDEQEEEPKKGVKDKSSLSDSASGSSPKGTDKDHSGHQTQHKTGLLHENKSEQEQDEELRKQPKDKSSSLGNASGSSSQTSVKSHAGHVKASKEL
ncbi:hypothetical protein PHYBOEH_004361 [Phytophthora boehmeriae]|uniref:Uncharacterized protein n=1 Tax=Phytophthora boehmeriae TaxID=109152 RepID=A0A8T1WR58_9STRA|nr:hypothetical protein PHYBOEH_004361 [Phytophthora boehmeriae]